MPIGCELGFTRSLHGVETIPDDWEVGLAESAFDISDYIGRVNAMKAQTPVLNEKGRQERVTSPDEPLVGLLRRGEDTDQRGLVLINPDPEQAQGFDPAAITGPLGAAAEDIHEITPAATADGADADAEADALARYEAGLKVAPRSIRVLVAG